MSKDTIYREDAIKAIWGDDINPSEDGMVFEAQSHIDKDIRLIPSADRPQSDDWEKYSDRLWKIAYERGKASVRPQGEWIPCSEREPSEFVDVLVCLTDGTMDVVKLTDYISIDGEPKWCHSTNYTLGGAILNEDVLAWMPLPKPYGEREGE